MISQIEPSGKRIKLPEQTVKVKVEDGKIKEIRVSCLFHLEGNTLSFPATCTIDWRLDSVLKLYLFVSDTQCTTILIADTIISAYPCSCGAVFAEAGVDGRGAILRPEGELVRLCERQCPVYL